MKKTTKRAEIAQLHKIGAELNGVIARRNLYKDHSRFVNARIIDGALTVENLATGERVPFGDGFRDGYGYPVHIEALTSKAKHRGSK